MLLLDCIMTARDNIRRGGVHLVQGAGVAVAEEAANHIEELRNYHRILDSLDELISAMIKRIEKSGS